MGGPYIPGMKLLEFTGYYMSKVKCLACGEVLESKHRHDFVMCKCKNETFVDGGTEYMRAGGINMSLVKVVNEEYAERK